MQLSISVFGGDRKIELFAFCDVPAQRAALHKAFSLVKVFHMRSHDRYYPRHKGADDILLQNPISDLS